MRPEWLVRARGKNKQLLGPEAIVIPSLFLPLAGHILPQGLGLALSSAFSFSSGLLSEQHPIQLSPTHGMIRDPWVYCGSPTGS